MPTPEDFDVIGMDEDDLEDAGRRAGPLTRFLATLPRRLGYKLGPSPATKPSPTGRTPDR